MASSTNFAVFHHDDCAKHNISKHPEQPARVTVTLDLLRKENASRVFKEAPLATSDHLALFHTRRLLETNANIFSKFQKKGAKQFSIDGDTAAMEFTEAAALRAVGAVIAAVDFVFGDRRSGDAAAVAVASAAEGNKSAFCCVRPPGHHAERDASMGFCFYNNAGIGAKYAQSTYGVNKVAVLDFDIHHGNGTEDGFLSEPNLFYGSTHQKEGYPCTGKDPSPFVGAKARNPVDRRIVNRHIKPGKKAANNNFREKWSEILDEMVVFAPDFVIISAGFDAHKDDPLSDSNLVEEDFAWATTAVFEACHRVNSANTIPVISVLEGGYNLYALMHSALAHVKALERGYSAISAAPAVESVFEATVEKLAAQLETVAIKEEVETSGESAAATAATAAEGENEQEEGEEGEKKEVEEA